MEPKTLLQLSDEMTAEGNDAAIFEMMHTLLAQEGREKHLERRENKRLPFTSPQLVALCNGNLSKLSGTDFEKHACHDLSQTGFSFYTPHEPTQTHAVLIIGNVPFKFLIAEIKHIKLLKDGQWQLGCKFVERLKK